MRIHRDTDNAIVAIEKDEKKGQFDYRYLLVEESKKLIENYEPAYNMTMDALNGDIDEEEFVKDFDNFTKMLLKDSFEFAKDSVLCFEEAVNFDEDLISKVNAMYDKVEVLEKKLDNCELLLKQINEKLGNNPE